MIENQGVAPDIEIEQAPRAIKAGRDPQLDAAVSSVPERLKNWQVVRRDVAPAAPAKLDE